MKLKQLFWPILLSFAFLLLWEGYVRVGFIPKTVLPTPSAILEAILNYWEILLGHTTQTVFEASIGLCIAIVLGVATAIGMFLSSQVKKSLYPFLVFSQTIPIIALGPLLLLWFGFDLLPKIIIVTLYCFFPITISVSDGLLHTNREYIDLLQSMKATKWQMFRFVRMPCTLPAFFSGLRIAVTYAITAAIVGEYVGAYQGLGVYMQQAANVRAVVLVFASLVVTTALSILLLGIVFLLERIIIPWKKNYA